MSVLVSLGITYISKFHHSGLKNEVSASKIKFPIKQDQIWSKAASQGQLATKQNYFKSTKQFQIQVISNPSDFKSK